VLIRNSTWLPWPMICADISKIFFPEATRQIMIMLL
jgi:hypothetical protein